MMTPVQITKWTDTKATGADEVISGVTSGPGVYVAVVDLSNLGGSDTATLRAIATDGSPVPLMTCNLAKTAGTDYGEAVVSDPIVWPDGIGITSLAITLDVTLASSVTMSVTLLRVA